MRKVDLLTVALVVVAAYLVVTWWRKRQSRELTLDELAAIGTIG
jgi:hypothetical protein